MYRFKVPNPSRFQTPEEPVAVEYDSRGKRVTKVFPNGYAARRFWTAKDAAGKNPKVKKPTATTEPSSVAIYVRVSTRQQDTKSQEADLQKFADSNGGSVRWFRDKATGKNFDRPGWSQLEQAIRVGEIKTVVVWRIDRLGRTAKGLTALFDDFRQRKVNLVSLRDGIELGTPGGRMLANVLASVAQFETEVRGERVAAGQAVARSQGKRWGGSKKGVRKKVTPVQIAMILTMRKQGASILAIARAVNLSRPTIYNVIES